MQKETRARALAETEAKTSTEVESGVVAAAVAAVLSLEASGHHGHGRPWGSTIVMERVDG